LTKKIPLLPPQTRYVTKGLLCQIEALDEGIKGIEDRMREVFLPTEEVKLLETLPGGGVHLDGGDRPGGRGCGKVPQR